MPFSDPLADGTTVQRAGEAALRNGITLADCVSEAAAVVRERDAPVLFMGYTNPFMQYGFARLATDGARAGIAGVIVPDMPAEESVELDTALAPAGLVRIDLYAPTTPNERLAKLLPRAQGFVYCVSLTGVTGARRALASDVADFVGRVRRHTTLPDRGGLRHQRARARVRAARHRRRHRGRQRGDRCRDEREARTARG